jgi:hypothetical protein
MGLFALKPLDLSRDKKELKVQFFWQPCYSHNFTDKIDLLTETLPSDGLKGIGDSYYLPYRDGDGTLRPIVSGQVFTFKAEDPEKQPLPSWDLLDMKWSLQRVVGMSGTGEMSRSEFDDDDDADDDADSNDDDDDYDRLS